MMIFDKLIKILPYGLSLAGNGRIIEQGESIAKLIQSSFGSDEVYFDEFFEIIFPQNMTWIELKSISNEAQHFNIQIKLNKLNLNAVVQFNSPQNIYHLYCTPIESENVVQTKTLEDHLFLSSFPLENPNPVLRFSKKDLSIVFCNEPARFFVDEIEKYEKAKSTIKQKLSEVVINQSQGKLNLEVGFKTFSVFLVPVQDKSYINAYCADITEQMKLENEFNIERMNRASQAKLTALGEMAGGIAHEINNPLAIIVGFCNQILRDINNDKFEPSKFKKNIENVLKTSKRIAKIVTSLKTISRNGDADPFQVVSLRDLVEEIVSLSSEKLKNLEIQISIKIKSELLVFAKVIQFEQVLMNLLINSIHALEKQVVGKWIEINAEIQQDQIIIQFIDSGNGLSESVRDKVMQPFFTTKPIGQGTGLGLSISYSIIQDHFGVLKYNEGHLNTCFEIRIPVVELAQLKKTA